MDHNTDVKMQKDEDEHKKFRDYGDMQGTVGVG